MANNASAQGLDIEVALTRSEKFINKYKKELIGGFVAVIVIALAWFGYHKWMTAREDAAQAQIAMGIGAFQSGDYDLALQGDTAATSGDAFKGFLKIAKKYSFTDGANIAHLYSGLCYYKKGDVKSAIAELKKFSTKGDATISPAALSALANCYAADGQLDKAVENFKKAADKADSEGLSPVYLMQAAQILESEKKFDEARKVYETIKKEYPTSQFAATGVQNGVVTGPVIDKYIERAAAAAK